MSPRERLLQIVILLVGVIAFGTLGYQLIEGWSPTARCRRATS